MKLRVGKTRGPVVLQDIGRPGLRSLGIPKGGFADVEAAKLANLLVGNLPSTPLLECTLGCPDLYFPESCTIALTGGSAEQSSIDGEPIEGYRTLHVAASTWLRGAVLNVGVYLYVAIGGAWQVANYRWRGSVSAIAGVDLPCSSMLRRGDELSIVAKLRKGQAYAAMPEPSERIHVSGGPESSMLRTRFGLVEQLARVHWRVSAQSNRMGVRLEAVGDNPLACLKPRSMWSNPLQPGTVQLLPDGHLIVAHVDAGTLGGYPRVGVLPTEDLATLSQSAAGSLLYFEWTR